MVSFGIEVIMSVICLVCGYIGCDSIIKFEGCYYGYFDSLLVKVGFGVLIFGVLNFLGVLVVFVKYILILLFNDIEVVCKILGEVGKEVVCIIVELVVGNMNCVLLVLGFFEGLCEVCDEYGVVLIFDEVMIGFCVVFGGVQVYYGVILDLLIFGKIIGGGMLVGVFGGKCEIMQQIFLLGLVYQVGMFLGNLLVMVVGLIILCLISCFGFYDELIVYIMCMFDGL